VRWGCRLARLCLDLSPSMKTMDTIVDRYTHSSQLVSPVLSISHAYPVAPTTYWSRLSKARLFRIGREIGFSPDWQHQTSDNQSRQNGEHS
ncbi:hypothetical protein, partial [Paraburkholderia caledonica]|uniref:hypothetical protein n=1 Tax=Paraburkholderia caledonica TaxID=134536 RepID=UPI001C4EEE4A